MRVWVILLLAVVLVGGVGATVCRAEDSTVRVGMEQPAYSLPPGELKQAVAYSRSRVLLDFAESGWGILQLFLLLALGVAAWMRDVAVRVGRWRWVQGLVFAVLLLGVSTALMLPLDLYGHHVAVEYGQSVEGWGEWSWDLVKTAVLTLAVGWPLVMLLFGVMRRSPERWWFWFWLPVMAVVILGVFVAPVAIDPLFNQFEPLAEHNPVLVERLEKVASRAGIAIPPDRMFLMKASEKVTGLNAYVTGFGASKRVVVWDTSIAKASPDEILFIFGHEMGHYALGHVPRTIAFLGGLLLCGFFLVHHGARWLIRRYGARWGVSSEHDWAALVVLLLVFSVVSFASEPIVNGYSRAQEHAADVYGQEAIHGIVADPQATAVRAFQVLGESSLADPNPNPFVVFWTFSHPSIESRATFSQDYNPWISGKHSMYFKR